MIIGKFTLSLLVVLATCMAQAEISSCVVGAKAIPLESTVTLHGVIVGNPMFSDIENVNELSSEQKSVMLMLKPATPILLEQWDNVVDKLSCSSRYVTLVLNDQQLKELQRAGAATALGLPTVVTLTGTIRWSESSVEVAGNAVLVNITQLSVR